MKNFVHTSKWEWSFVISTSLNSLNSSKLFAKNHVVIYHQKLFWIIYQLTTPLDPSSALLKAKNWKGFVTQSLESFTFSTQTVRFWITPLFEALDFFFFTLQEGTTVRFRGRSLVKGKKAAEKEKVEKGSSWGPWYTSRDILHFVVFCWRCSLEALEAELACHRHILTYSSFRSI